MKYKMRNNNSGFTLLELIVSISVITILIAIFFTNYHGADQRTNLTSVAQKLVSDIRTAQNNSLGSVPYGGVLPAGGWGIHLDTTNNNKYLLFADVNNNKVYDVGEALPASGGSTFTLPANTVISDLTDGGSHSNLDITFLPPDPITRIYWSQFSSSTIASIVIKQNIVNRTENVNVNILGLIETR
jgi:prepilin-type N-terminal cleavage/methylation domain-containing protein